MFNTISMTGTGLAGVLVWILVSVGTYLGIDILEADAVTFVSNTLAIAGLILTYWGQWRRKDLVGGIRRKS